MGEGRLVAAMRRGINQFIHAFISGDAGMPADPYEDEFEAAMDGRLRDGAEGPEEGVVGVQMREGRAYAIVVWTPLRLSVNM